MPLYEYRCSTCGSDYEELQKIDEPPPEKACSAGGSCSLVKKMSRGSFSFVGDGWGPSRPKEVEPTPLPTVTMRSGGKVIEKIPATLTPVNVT